MSHDPHPLLDSLPTISDESVVEILDFLQAFVLGFKSLYSGQIRRYYDERSRANLMQSEPTASLEEPPF
ncbi:MAG: hypothetical protein HY306_08550 [Nitrosomonadales bacterium]|nr:hypothetical protein [Nitrosomonadales bacterium]